MGQFIATLPETAELPAVEVVIPAGRDSRLPRVHRIARCTSSECHGPNTYQFPTLDAALRWVAGYCGPWGCRIRNLLYDLREA